MQITEKTPLASPRAARSRWPVLLVAGLLGLAGWCLWPQPLLQMSPSLGLCSASQDGNLFVARTIELRPDPPSLGAPLRITVKGKALTDLGDFGSSKLTADIEVYIHETITVYHTQKKLCDAELDCPIRAGEIDFVKTVDIPHTVPIPPIPLKIKIQVNQDSRPVTCIVAHFQLR